MEAGSKEVQPVLESLKPLEASPQFGPTSVLYSIPPSQTDPDLRYHVSASHAQKFNVWPPNNPRAVIQLIMGILLAANLVAAYFVTAHLDDRRRDCANKSPMRGQLRQQQALLDRTHVLASKIESGRAEGDQFMNQYFLPRRTAYSSVMADLNELASQTKVTPRKALTPSSRSRAPMFSR